MAFNAFLEKLDKKLHEENKINEYLEKAEKATGVRRLYIALGKFLLSCFQISPKTVDNV